MFIFYPENAIYIIIIITIVIGDKLTLELGFRVGFRVRISNWIFKLDFRVRILSWIFE